MIAIILVMAGLGAAGRRAGLRVNLLQSGPLPRIVVGTPGLAGFVLFVACSR